MTQRTLTCVPPDRPTATRGPEPDARRLVGRQIGFLGHFVVYSMTLALLLSTAGSLPTVIVALAWGIGLGAHGFFAVAAPMMRPALERHTRQLLAPSPPSPPAVLEVRASRPLEELSAAVAHEIRNPIAAAKSLVQQMAEDPASPRNPEYASVAIAELDRVERTIVHLLRFARDEPIDAAEMQMGDVVRAAVETLRDRVAKAGVSLVTSIDDTGAMRGDADKLRRVVENLVSNALDALEEGHAPDPCIDVASGANLAGDSVWVAVRDNGPGIPADALPGIFRPFFTTKDHGTGFGLALSKKTIDAHGGTIEAGSSPSGGAEIVFTVPRGSGARADRAS
jgi:signal transduction histidine kinase